MIEHYLNIGLEKYKDDIAPFVAGCGEQVTIIGKNIVHEQ